MIVCRVRPRKGVKLQAFWANRSKNLALWCRKWREGNTIFEQCGNPRSVNYLILNVFFSSLLVKWKLFVLSWLFQQTLLKTDSLARNWVMNQLLTHWCYALGFQLIEIIVVLKSIKIITINKINNLRRGLRNISN